MTAATIALLALTAAVAGAVVIGSAHKFRYVQTTATVSGGGAPFMGSTDCGSGFAAVSGGTVASGTIGELSGDGSFTTGTHRLWRSTGFNTGFGKNVSTVALCRKAGPSITYVKQQKTLPASPSVVGAQAKCNNKVVAGGGVAVQGPLSQVHVSASTPDAVGRSWKATVVNDSGGARSFTVYAVCLPVSAGLSYEKFSIPEPSNPNGFDADLTCGVAGEIPLTGGVSWSGNQHQVQIASAGPINSSGGVNTIPDTAWRVGTANMAGAAKTETGEVICAPA